jgi:DNA-directed RNA polymerase subunit M/transcription elongation factor TFIIS
VSSTSGTSLEFRCPNCSRRLRIGAHAAGRTLQCPSCAQPVVVPQPSTAVPVQQAATADQLSDASPEGLDAANTPPLSLAGESPHGSASESANASRRVAADAADAATDASGASPGAGDAADGAEQRDAPVHKRSIFDDDLPDLAELEPSTNRGNLQAILGIQGLDELLPPAPPPVTQRPGGSGQPPTGPRSVASRAQGGAEPPRAPAPRPASASHRGATPHDTAAAGPAGDAGEAELDPREQQYRVSCPRCDTPHYVRVKEQGQKLKCPDCHSEFKIPGPPPGWRPSSKPPQDNWGTGLLNSWEDDVKTHQRSREQAESMLSKAAAELDEDELDKLYQGDFDMTGFVRRTFGFLHDPTVVIHVVAYACAFSLLYGVAAYWDLKLAEGDNGFAFLRWISVPLVQLIIALPMFSVLVALLEAVANGQTKIPEWRGFNLMEDLGEIFLFMCAFVAAILPGVVLGRMLAPDWGPYQTMLSMLSTFLLLPITLLSMLDHGSIFPPLSTDVVKSLRLATEAWGTYYLKTGVAFAIVLVTALVLASAQPLGGAVVGFLIPFLIFFTTQQLGVLALDIGDHLSFAHSTERDEDAADSRSPAGTTQDDRESGATG